MILNQIPHFLPKTKTKIIITLFTSKNKKKTKGFTSSPDKTSYVHGSRTEHKHTDACSKQTKLRRPQEAFSLFTVFVQSERSASTAGTGDQKLYCPCKTL
ncbi:hypothetical protein PAMP_010839 [Pampus punctatissimus]